MAKKIPDTLYTIKEHSQDKNKYTVGKIDRDFGTLEAYSITIQESGEHICTCPSRFIPCKHVKLLKHAKAAYPEDYQHLYWHVAPHAKWIESYSEEDMKAEAS